VNKLLQPPTTSWQCWFHRLYRKGSVMTLGRHTASTCLSGQPSCTSFCSCSNLPKFTWGAGAW
jgi:hypothetical protein